jgi:hypothetical protein
MASKLLSPNTALISTPRPHHYQRPPQITRTLDGQPPDTTTVASAQNQCSPFLDAESIAVRVPSRRLFLPANFIAKSSTPANQHLVRPHLQPSTVYVATAKVTSIQNGPTSNPTKPPSEPSRQHRQVYIQPLPMYPVEPLHLRRLRSNHWPSLYRPNRSCGSNYILVTPTIAMPSSLPAKN